MKHFQKLKLQLGKLTKVENGIQQERIEEKKMKWRIKENVKGLRSKMRKWHIAQRKKTIFFFFYFFL